MTLSNYEPSVAPLDGRTLPEYVLRELRRIGGIFREYSLELSPGGATGEVQFNDNGSLTGDSVFTYDKAANVLNVPHIALDKLSFDLSASGSISTGQLLWNADDGTLDLGLSNGAVLQIGQEVVYYSKNTSGSTISTGRAVMFTGAIGTSGKLTFGLAVANGTVDHEYMMGIASQNIPDNDFGMVTHFGLVRNLRTDGANKTVPETWSDGVLLYFDPSYPGELTRNKPTFPGFAMPIAVVVNATSGNSGSLFVRMKTGERLSELHDVNITSLSDGHILRYNASASYWQAVALPGGGGGGAPVTVGAGLSVSGSYQVLLDVGNLTQRSASTSELMLLAFDSSSSAHVKVAVSSLPSAGGGGATDLDGLTDVNLSVKSPTRGDVLVYTGTQWEAFSGGPKYDRTNGGPLVNDEFEYGTSLDQTGARYANALPWVRIGGDAVVYVEPWDSSLVIDASATKTVSGGYGFYGFNIGTVSYSFIFTAKLTGWLNLASFARGLIGFGEASASTAQQVLDGPRLELWMVFSTTRRFEFVQRNPFTSINLANTQDTVAWDNQDVYIRIRGNGTLVQPQWSFNGTKWNTLTATVSVNAYMPGQIGWIFLGGEASDVSTNLSKWKFDWFRFYKK